MLCGVVVVVDDDVVAGVVVVVVVVVGVRTWSITAIRPQKPQTRSPISAIRLRSSVENGHFRKSAIKRSSDQETSITRSQRDPRSTTVSALDYVVHIAQNDHKSNAE